ncbi:MAG: hypothetical protein U0670_14760 [Anaerolineae bacterium]
MTKKTISSSPIPRHLVLMLDSGDVVVMWSDKLAQDIATGRTFERSPKDFGRRLSDSELTRLEELHQVEAYNRSYVWLYALPEQARFAALRVQESSQPRYYYLNTTLSADHLDDVYVFLHESELAGIGAEAHVRDGVIAITAEQGYLFPQLSDAETALTHLMEKAPDWLRATTIAFADVAEFAETDSARDESEPLDLDALIKAQDAAKAASQAEVPSALGFHASVNDDDPPAAETQD